MGGAMAFLSRFAAGRYAVSEVAKFNYVRAQQHFSTATEAHFQTTPFKLHKLDEGPTTDVSVTRDDALRFYKQMQVIRRMEQSASNLYKEKAIRGFCHLSSGQEACAVGAVEVMEKGDALITAYRCHGFAYLLGVTVTEILAELTGRYSGIVHGKGGSMHMYGDSFYGGNGIVGAQIPIGAGIAFAMKYRKEKSVCLTLYGDGAANQGQFFETTNMAKLWDLPVIFICENNGYGMGTSADRASACTDYYTRGDFVPGIWTDGMDVLAVREAVKWAANYCRQGHGPLVLEFATYRYHGHSMSDPGTSYRTREEIQEVRKSRDPITGFKDKILSANLVTEAELKAVEKEVRREVDVSTEAAHKDPVIDLDALYTDVYANTPNYNVRGVAHDVLVTPNPQFSGEIAAKMAKA